MALQFHLSLTYPLYIYIFSIFARSRIIIYSYNYWLPYGSCLFLYALIILYIVTFIYIFDGFWNRFSRVVFYLNRLELEVATFRSRSVVVGSGWNRSWVVDSNDGQTPSILTHHKPQSIWLYNFLYRLFIQHYKYILSSSALIRIIITSYNYWLPYGNCLFLYALIILYIVTFLNIFETF